MSGGALALRLVVFGAFAAYGALHWSMLVASPSATVVTATIAATVAGALGLALLDRSPTLPRRLLQPLAALIVLASLIAGLVAAGVAPRLLLPTGWGELADLLRPALVGVQTVDWPYDGPDVWIRRTILLGAPLLLTTAAALAFWPVPAEMRRPLRGSALVVLIALYAIAVITKDPGSPLLFGALLLALIAAWLWLPRRRGRELATAAAVVLAVALAAVPVATALDGERPWFDYRSWSPFGDKRGIAFGWDHRYGPLDWPRQGTTLLRVRSESPHYWKAATLNGFDGIRWHRPAGYEQPRDIGAELPFERDARPDPGGWSYGELNEDWVHQIRFTVRSLSTELLVGAGLTYDVDGAAAMPSADGTTQLLSGTLERGDSYTIDSYEPNPTAAEMAGAPTRYPQWVERYTELSLPASGSTLATGPSSVVVPPRGNRASPDERAEAEALLSGSAYRQTYALARTLTAGSASVYDAVEDVESHLRESYDYDERVPERAYPLESFLFEDRRGYCQQFSGAMALMLRMVGIPARVAVGFSPGTLDRDSGEYRVRDLDAHSWVEVYFAGIGWVTFDPTPRAQDAEPAAGLTAVDGSLAAGQVRQGSSGPAPAPPADDGAESAQSPNAVAQTGTEQSGAGGPPTALLLALALCALAAASAGAFAIRVRRRNGLDGERLAAAEIAELRSALERLGWNVSPATTLLALESQLARTAGPLAADYAQALRSYRFDPRSGRPPGPAERRKLRQALGAAAGRLGRLRALIAIPPGGPSNPSPS
ncbi:MAG TPA: transglutaminaseTgpA domain-containing protein [Thermoleophilaceae bacterium]|nr:transglutaminaseTgpA domain-containing protein [Thermoleophilaceae bacterium]